MTVPRPYFHLAALFLLLLMSLVGGPAKAAPEDASEAFAIAVLEPSDIELYQKIFAAQARADWAEADRLIRRLKDRILLGHVLYERYMHPNAYRSSYGELARWMKNYADQPGAERLYRLAAKRRPKGHAAPRLPVPTRKQPPPEPQEQLTKKELDLRRARYQAQTAINQHLKQAQPELAEKQLWAANERALFEKESFTTLLSRVAASYFHAGNDAKALSLATLSAAGEGSGRFAGNWVGGLAAWRQGNCALSAGHFERATVAASERPWDASAAAFWAARARLACRQPEAVARLLDRAAYNNRTFYGMIAARQLGRDIAFSWEHPPFPWKDYRSISGLPGVRRAVALSQVGRIDWADVELRYVWQRSEDDRHQAILGLASRLNLPSTQVRAAKLMERREMMMVDSALYPVPDFAPTGGYSIDRAVIFAFMRQESEFNTLAVSSAGARGLMQLMPATASFIGRDRSLKSPTSTKLNDPTLNIALGQRYIEHLLEDRNMKGNLLLTAAAYNGGPGNVNRWLQRGNFSDDPFLFIETIPLEETRLYVTRVLTNLWAYRMRMGQPTPELDALAQGQWPVYKPLDDKKS